MLPNTDYSFRVLPVNRVGTANSAPSISLHTFPAPPPRPLPPTLLSATPSSLKLSFDVSPSYELRGNDKASLQFYLDGDTEQLGQLTPLYTGPNTSFALSGLKPARCYHFRLAIGTPFGWSPFSPIISFSTKPSVPLPPRNLRVAPLDPVFSPLSFIRIEWNDPDCDNGSPIRCYHVEMAAGKSPANQNFAEISLEDEDVVVLPEFSTKTEQAPQVLTQKQPSLLRQSFSKFTENSIQRRARKKPPKKPEKKENAEIKSVEIPKEIRVYEFADKLNKNVSEIISKLFMLGMMTTKNDFLDEDAIEILASEFGIEVNIIDEADEFDYLKNYDAKEDNEEDLSPRAPVITIMGHVDHGKTSLLDYIRNSRVVNAEAGGITQHVGAYMVEKNKRKITFIDTPGHEAFTAMRARGAGITDIVIIVVAADDGVKPQTKEAINHAKAANVPIIIAINKIDKEGANVDMVKTQLSELDIVPTEWGGSYEFVQVSAKKGTGVDDLLELVLLQADILELKANSKAKAKASIIESSLQKGRGPVATVIVQNGTLKIGNTVVAGVAYGKVRALNDDRGNALKEIKPGECGVIVGLSEIAQAGETLIAVQSDKEAREYAAKRYEYNRQKELSKSTKVSIDELSTKIKEGNLKSLPVILKADVQGSLEAIKSSLEKLVNDEIKVNIIHSGIGGISQSDIELASASENSVVLGFNVRPTGEIKEKAKDKGIEIKTYNVIYNLIDDVKALLSGMMSPIISEEQLGQAEIRQVISVPKIGLIAGCMVSEGVINRGAKIRLIRDGVVLFEGSVSSLKRFKDDVKEVAKGFECGVGIEGCTDMKVGDYIESYKEISQMASI